MELTCATQSCVVHTINHTCFHEEFQASCLAHISGIQADSIPTVLDIIIRRVKPFSTDNVDFVDLPYNIGMTRVEEGSENPAMKGVYICVFNEVEIQDFKSNKHNTIDSLTHDSSNNRIITYWQDAECAAEKKAGKEK